MKIEDYFDLCLKLDIDIKKKESGKYKIYTSVYGKGTKFRIIPKSHQAFLMGFEQTEIILESDFKYYELFYNTERLMTNDGAEIFEHYIPYLRAHGNVLVGGLGLGFITKLIAQKDTVDRITVVDISEDVINLCGFSHKKVEIINYDFYSFMRENKLSNYDYVYIDTYTSGPDIYKDIVISTRKYLLENHPTLMFDFWQEDQLKAQYLLDSLKVKNF